MKIKSNNKKSFLVDFPIFIFSNIKFIKKEEKLSYPYLYEYYYITVCVLIPANKQINRISNMRSLVLIKSFNDEFIKLA